MRLKAAEALLMYHIQLLRLRSSTELPLKGISITDH